MKEKVSLILLNYSGLSIFLLPPSQHDCPPPRGVFISQNVRPNDHAPKNECADFHDIRPKRSVLEINK